MLKEGEEKGRKECSQARREETKEEGRQEGVISRARWVGGTPGLGYRGSGGCCLGSFPVRQPRMGWDLGEQRRQRWEALLSCCFAAVNTAVKGTFGWTGKGSKPGVF